MNVEVLGDDIYYGASMNTLFAKQRQKAALIAKMRKGQRFGSAVFMGDDELLGVDWGAFGKGLSKIGSGVVKLVKSPGGKVVGAAALTAVAGRLTPTQKAQIATVQEAAGMAPQVIAGGGSTSIAQPLGQPSINTYLPYIIGGVGLLAVVLIATKK